MSAVSDSSQEASNTGINSGLTPVSSPNIFMKGEIPELQSSNLFNNNPNLLKPSTSTEQSQKRRSSSRSIKRKKFDDELVESSLIKTSRARPQNVTFPLLSPSVSLSSPNVTPVPSVASTSQTPSDAAPVLALEKKKPRPPQKRIKKPKSNQAHLTKDASRWKPSDDLSLILSVIQTNDFETVHLGVKFSSKFSLQEIQERWYALLYDPSVSKPALFAVRQMSPDVRAQIHAKVLFSEQEQKLLASVPSTDGNLEVFQNLLDSNASVFLPSRTAKVLYEHWTLMKQYYLLTDQAVQAGMQNSSHILEASVTASISGVLTITAGIIYSFHVIKKGICMELTNFVIQLMIEENVPGHFQTEYRLNFHNKEESLDYSETSEPKEPLLEEEIANADRRVLQEIKQLENELPRWQVVVDCITGVSLPDFDNKTLAVLRGRIVRYLIQSREVTLGRSAKDNNVDIDLSLEGPALKISRRQGIIKMDNNSEFFVINEGKKPIFVDGKPVISGNKCKLSNNTVIEITMLRFIFIINQEAIAALKTKNSC